MKEDCDCKHSHEQWYDKVDWEMVIMTAIVCASILIYLIGLMVLV